MEQKCNYVGCKKQGEVRIHFDYTKGEWIIKALFGFSKKYNTTEEYCLKHAVWIRKNDNSITEVIGASLNSLPTINGRVSLEAN